MPSRATRWRSHEPGAAGRGATSLKIAFVRARYSSHGGAERFASRALAALATQDEVVDLAILARRWDAAPPSVRVIGCDPFYLGSTWRDVSFARCVRQVVAHESFDLVQSHERIPGLSIYRAGDGVHAAWLERRTRHAGLGARLAVAANPHHRYLVAAERAMFEHRGLRAVICNSTMVRDEILARFAIDPAKLVLIRNGVDLDRFHPSARAAHRAAVRMRLGLTGSTPVFVLVGSGFARKGVALAIDALADVSDTVLVVVGGDRHLRRYRERAARAGVADRVRFAGPVDDVLPWLAMADAFVLPTLYDPFPNAALEAWAVGLPVITSRASGAAELVEEGVNGWLVDAHDPAPLAAALRDAAARPPDRVDEMANAARRTASPWSLDTLAAALTALYRGMLTRR